MKFQGVTNKGYTSQTFQPSTFQPTLMNSTMMNPTKQISLEENMKIVETLSYNAIQLKKNEPVERKTYRRDRPDDFFLFFIHKALLTTDSDMIQQIRCISHFYAQSSSNRAIWDLVYILTEMNEKERSSIVNSQEVPKLGKGDNGGRLKCLTCISFICNTLKFHAVIYQNFLVFNCKFTIDSIIESAFL